jgi:hypothetical protein
MRDIVARLHKLHMSVLRNVRLLHRATIISCYFEIGTECSPAGRMSTHGHHVLRGPDGRQQELETAASLTNSSYDRDVTARKYAYTENISRPVDPSTMGEG